MSEQPSRIERWQEAAQKAIEVLSELENLRGEFEQQHETLPEHLHESVLAAKLRTIADLHILTALAIAYEAAETELLPELDAIL